MIKCTILNRDGEVHDLKEYPKRYRPRDGWERLKNGNFIKRLDDPRSITSKERIAALERIKKRKMLPEPKIVDASTLVKLSHKDPTTVYPSKRITLQSFLAGFKPNKISSGGIAIVMDWVHRLKIDIPGVKENYFKRIIIQVKANKISMWLDNSKTIGPDYVIFDFLKIPKI